MKLESLRELCSCVDQRTPEPRSCKFSVEEFTWPFIILNGYVRWSDAVIHQALEANNVDVIKQDTYSINGNKSVPMASH